MQSFPLFSQQGWRLYDSHVFFPFRFIVSQKTHRRLHCLSTLQVSFIALCLIYVFCNLFLLSQTGDLDTQSSRIRIGSTSECYRLSRIPVLHNTLSFLCSEEHMFYVLNNNLFSLMETLEKSGSYECRFSQYTLLFIVIFLANTFIMMF